jgi:hypothetical protein
MYITLLWDLFSYKNPDENYTLYLPCSLFVKWYLNARRPTVAKKLHLLDGLRHPLAGNRGLPASTFVRKAKISSTALNPTSSK